MNLVVNIGSKNPIKNQATKEAVSAGYYTSDLWQKNYPKIQILTIEELLDEKQIEMPPQHGTFKQAEKVKKEEVQGKVEML